MKSIILYFAIILIKGLVKSATQNCQYACLDQYSQCAVKETDCVTYLSSHCKNMICNSCCISKEYNHHCGNTDECETFSNESFMYIIIFSSIMGGIIVFIIICLLRRQCIKIRMARQKNADLQIPVISASIQTNKIESISKQETRSTGISNQNNDENSVGNDSIYFHTMERKIREMNDDL